MNLRTSSNASLQLNLARTRNLLPQQRHQQQQHADDDDDGRGRWRPRRPEQDAWRWTARPVSAQSWYADAYPENVTYSRTEQVNAKWGLRTRRRCNDQFLKELVHMAERKCAMRGSSGGGRRESQSQEDGCAAQADRQTAGGQACMR